MLYAISYKLAYWACQTGPKYKLHLKLNYKLMREKVLMSNLISVVKNRMHDRNNAHLFSKMCDAK